MRTSGGSRSSSSSSSSYSSSGSSGGDGALADLIIFLMEISLFFRYCILTGIALIVILGLLLAFVGVNTFGLYVFLGLWVAFSLYGLAYDIVDIFYSIKYRIQDKHPEKMEADVRSIGGIGPKRAKKLRALEIYTLADLAVANPDTIASKGISKKLATRFVKTAQEKTGLKPEDVENMKIKEQQQSK